MAHDFFRTMEIQSSAAAVQNLLLAATSLGLGTVWLGILYLIKDDLLPFFGEPKGEFMACSGGLRLPCQQRPQKTASRNEAEISGLKKAPDFSGA